jgi:hypothetical protein
MSLTKPNGLFATSALKRAIKPNGLFSSLKRMPTSYDVIKRAMEEPEELANLEEFLMDGEDDLEGEDNDDLVEYLEEEEEGEDGMDHEEAVEEDGEEEGKERTEGGEKKTEVASL